MISHERVDRSKDSGRKFRMRSRAQWAFVIAVIGYSGVMVSLVQYLNEGFVSIRPGYDAVTGRDAVELLITIAFISTGFLSYGLYLFSKIRR